MTFGTWTLIPGNKGGAHFPRVSVWDLQADRKPCIVDGRRRDGTVVTWGFDQ